MSYRFDAATSRRLFSCHSERTLSVSEGAVEESRFVSLHGARASSACGPPQEIPLVGCHPTPDLPLPGSPPTWGREPSPSREGEPSRRDDMKALRAFGGILAIASLPSLAPRTTIMVASQGAEGGAEFALEEVADRGLVGADLDEADLGVPGIDELPDGLDDGFDLRTAGHLFWCGIRVYPGIFATGTLRAATRIDKTSSRRITTPVDAGPPLRHFVHWPNATRQVRSAGSWSSSRTQPMWRSAEYRTASVAPVSSRPGSKPL